MTSTCWWQRGSIEKIQKTETIILKRYDAGNSPGEHWSSYGSSKPQDVRELDSKGSRDLRRKLHDMLTPSASQKELERIPKRPGVSYCPFLRLKQKILSRKVWLVDNPVHTGAHMPLAVRSQNAHARSEDAVSRRSAKYKRKLDKRSADSWWQWQNPYPLSR